MPGIRTCSEPKAAAYDLSPSDEAFQLERNLRSEFEEDVARIFDESLYSDLELVCGRSKIKTHSCILKARTQSFYQRLQNILHVNISRNTYDEIYSFISDAYTECNIESQEKDIIDYLSKNFIISDQLITDCKKKQTLEIPGATTAFDGLNSNQIFEDPDVYLTPKCISPNIENPQAKSVSSSPSIELTKEYYALVPIDTKLLEKELEEQDALSNAFESIIKSQKVSEHNPSSRVKPNSLSLKSSHSPKKILNSNSGDVLVQNKTKHTTSNQPGYVNGNKKKGPGIFHEKSKTLNSEHSLEENKDKNTESNISPDSLIADDPSSSPDYLSATYYSPGASISRSNVHINAAINVTNMENVTSSDSGLENSALLESLNAQRDVTLTDFSITESTLHDYSIDDTSLVECQTQQRQRCEDDVVRSSTSTDRYYEDGMRQVLQNKENSICKSTKEEKQRHNEEIVILESSSLSSETGSWESVFPLKCSEKDACVAFLNNERIFYKQDIAPKPQQNVNLNENKPMETSHKSPYKSSFCFIDAASLADDMQTDTAECPTKPLFISETLPTPSQPMPCATAKHDISPNDWSESHDDSLEQVDSKETDSLQKGLSPTIFEMTPLTEDSLSTNPFENANDTVNCGTGSIDVEDEVNEKDQCFVNNTVFVSNTPHNSILSLKTSSTKNIDSEGDSDTTIVSYEGPSSLRNIRKFTDSSPIVSGGASVEDHLPQITHTGSPMSRRKVDNMPIVSGAYIPDKGDKKEMKKSLKASSASAWVVDMSSTAADTVSLTHPSTRKPWDRTCDSLKNESKYYHDNSKSRSSVDSDSSERSSHKFYIDLASLPDPLPSTNDNRSQSVVEKKNIFSMYIELGENIPVKEMPARLSSSLNTKKNVQEPKTQDSKSCTKSIKADSTSTTKLSSRRDNIDTLQNTTFDERFEEYEALCSNPDISITEIIGIDKTKELGKSLVNVDKKGKKNENSLKITTGESVNISSEAFVRLSDLDKPSPAKLATDSTNIIHEYSISAIRMTRSIPDSNWDDRCHNTNLRSSDVISSFHSENAGSLNRLFPHLKNEFSRSMPGSLSSRTRSPLRAIISTSNGEIENPSDISELSSIQSSYCRSVVENSTTEDSQSQTSSLIGNCQSKLGQDLLRMFLEEIAPDVIVEVSGRRFKAHKCILSSRCQYFAGILSGGWVESAGNVIVLPPFSYNVVHFALCHIYSGLSTIPDSISIVELATIADMLGLEGLKEAIMFTLKAKYCHHFHKPCSVCTAGVLECFPLSSVYGLDDLYRKCLKWITKHFHKVWPTKAFATLPKELLDKCFQQHIINMTTDNLIDTICACGMTEASLQSSRWSETVSVLCRRLVSAASHFAASRLWAAVRATGALPADLPPPAARALDRSLGTAIDWAPSDEITRTYTFLSQVVKEIKSQQNSKPDLLSNGDIMNYSTQSFLCSRAVDWKGRCERAYDRSAPRVIDSHLFKDLPQELRKRLKDIGCIVYGGRSASSSSSTIQEKKEKPHYTRASKSHSRNMDIDHVRTSFVPYATKPTMQQCSNENLKYSKCTLRNTTLVFSNPPKIRTTKAQEERAKYNMAQTSSQERSGNRNITRPNRFENTKPRYLEPKTLKDEKKSQAVNRLTVRVASSSESSRNSSPVQARNVRRGQRGWEGARAGGAGGRPRLAASQDSLATGSRPCTAEPSTDSLSESQNSNKYATYTKAKHIKGSVESVNKTSNQPYAQAYSKKTKIPVYLNHAKSVDMGQKPYVNGSSLNKLTPPPLPNQTIPNKRVAGSLMSATKSSSAKVVARPNKEQTNKNNPKQKAKTRVASKQEALTEPQPREVPVMERSGTFLKDEPTFGDKTTNIDIG